MKCISSLSRVLRLMAWGLLWLTAGAATVSSATPNGSSAAVGSGTVVVQPNAANPRMPAIELGADRILSLQRTDAGWEGTWFWYVGNTSNVTNLTGITALGALEAYVDTKDRRYLDAAKAAAAFSMTHLGSGATGTKYALRMTAPDLMLLHLLTQLTGDGSYSVRANSEWANIKTFWPTAATLDGLFRTINRRLGAWDLAAYLEAASLSGDKIWADEAADILANSADAFYYDQGNPSYPLTVSGALRVLAAYGYSSAYPSDVESLRNMLIAMIEGDNIAGDVQATAYGIMALDAVGGSNHNSALPMAKWLAARQGANGGWLESGDEYPEIDAEAVRAMSITIGSNLIR